MSRRSIIRKFQVLTDADSAIGPESEPTDVSSVDFITYQLSVDNTVSAELEVLFSNEADATIDNYKPLNFNQTLTLDGSSDQDYMVHIENKGFRFLKLALTDGGGSGNVNAWISGTVRGA